MANKLILALLPLVAFGLPTRDGQEVEVDEKQADELVELGYAKIVDKKADAKAKKIADATEALKVASDELEGLSDDATEEEKAAATKLVEDAKAALDKLSK
jgi:hypothetical protein